MDSVRVGVIGCGGRGRGHIRSLKEFEDVHLAAVCDPVVDIRESVCEEYGIDGQYGDVSAMLEGEALDAVFVAPPAHLNATLALPCLEAGVNTFLEKPPGLSLKERNGRESDGGMESAVSSDYCRGAESGAGSRSRDAVGGGVPQEYHGFGKFGQVCRGADGLYAF